MCDSAGSGQTRFRADVLSRALTTILITYSLITLSSAQHYRTIQIHQWSIKLLENPAITLPSKSCNFYKGKVTDEPNSSVILTECDKKLHVLVQVNDKKYVVDGDTLSKAHVLQRRHVTPSQLYNEDFFELKSLDGNEYERTENYVDDTVTLFEEDSKAQDDDDSTGNNLDEKQNTNEESLLRKKSINKNSRDIHTKTSSKEEETKLFLLNLHPFKDSDNNLYSSVITADINIKKTIKQTVLKQNLTPETDNDMYTEISDADVDAEGQKDYMNDLELNYNEPVSEINILQDGYDDINNFDIELLKEGETINLSEDVITNSVNYVQINPKSFFNSGGPIHDGDVQKFQLELALIVDESVIQFHGEEKLHRYILAMMNIVSVIMSDPSLGANMELIIKKLIKYKKTSKISLELANKVNYRALLNSESQNEGGWDAAIFLTREKFGPSGHAYEAEICSKSKSTVLVYDYGLHSAFVVAHELGHLLGIKHDVKNNCGEDVKHSIMAEYVLSAFHKYHWSSCSRTDFLQNSEQWNCLRHHDEANESIRLGKSQIVDYAFSRDEQCRQTFGEGYIACKIGRESCTELLCASRINPTNCESNYSPLTGTRCGKNKWCTEGVCKSRPLFPSNPQWGAWGPWSPLARTNCGYQLMVRHRKCYDSSTETPDKCEGSPSELSTVWTGQQCEDAQDPRAMMCRDKKQNLIPYEHENPEEHCNLWCADAYGGEIWNFGQIRDGMPCTYSRSHDLCFLGKCVKGGCDSLDYSCNWCPDGHCDSYTVSSSKTLDKTGWTSLLKIPKGVHNSSLWIYFDHPIEMAVQNGDRSYLKFSVHSNVTQNGYNLPFPLELRTRHLKSSRRKLTRMNADIAADINGAGRLVVNGSLLSWTFTDNSYVINAELLSHTEVHVIAGWNNQYFHQPAPTVTYTLNYSVPLHTSNDFEWATGDWEECSATCGDGGVQIRQLFCIPSDTRSNSHSELTKKMVSTIFCDSKKQPISERACNRGPCLGYWTKGALTPCSATCGTGFSIQQLICSTNYCAEKPMERRVKCTVRKKCPIHCKRSVDSAFCMFFAGNDLKRYCDVKLFRKKCCLACGML